MKQKDKKILRTQPVYRYIAFPILLIASIFVYSLPDILSLDGYKRIMCYTIFTVCFAIFAYVTLRYAEFTIVSDKGIFIVCPFKKLKSFKTDEIKVITVQELYNTYPGQAPLRDICIVIKTNPSIQASCGYNDNSDRGFGQLVASKKNVTVIKEFADKFGIPFEQEAFRHNNKFSQHKNALQNQEKTAVKPKSKKMLRTLSCYSIILTFICAAFFFIFLFIPDILSWDKGSMLEQILFYSTATAFFVISFCIQEQNDTDKTTASKNIKYFFIK